MNSFIPPSSSTSSNLPVTAFAAGAGIEPMQQLQPAANANNALLDERNVDEMKDSPEITRLSEANKWLRFIRSALRFSDAPMIFNSTLISLPKLIPLEKRVITNASLQFAASAFWAWQRRTEAKKKEFFLKLFTFATNLGLFNDISLKFILGPLQKTLADLGLGPKEKGLDDWVFVVWLCITGTISGFYTFGCKCENCCPTATVLEEKFVPIDVAEDKEEKKEITPYEVHNWKQCLRWLIELTFKRALPLGNAILSITNRAQESELGLKCALLVVLGGAIPAAAVDTAAWVDKSRNISTIKSAEIYSAIKKVLEILPLAIYSCLRVAEIAKAGLSPLPAVALALSVGQLLFPLGMGLYECCCHQTTQREGTTLPLLHDNNDRNHDRDSSTDSNISLSSSSASSSTSGIAQHDEHSSNALEAGRTPTITKPLGRRESACTRFWGYCSFGWLRRNEAHAQEPSTSPQQS